MKLNKQGQTLIEVLIAIGIMTVGIISVVSLALTSNVISRRSSKEFIATNLAREGIEVVRSIRDGNWLEIESGNVSDIEFNDGLYEEDSGTYDYSAIINFDAENVYIDESFVATGGIWSLFFSGLDGDINSFEDDETIIYFDDISKLYTQVIEDSDEGFYKATPYRRLITINPICYDSDESYNDLIGGDIITSDYCGTDYSAQIGIQVISEVQWQESNNKTYSKILETKLYDWKE